MAGVSSMDPPPSKPGLGRLLPLCLSIILLAAVLWQFDGWSLLRRLDPLKISVALIIALLLDTGVGALKWWWVLQRLGQEISLFTIWRIWTGLLPLTFFAPFQSGHALYPPILARVTGIDLVVAAESVIYDKSLSLVSTFALIALGQGLLPRDHPLAQLGILLAALLVVALWFGEKPALALLRRVLQRWLPKTTDDTQPGTQTRRTKLAQWLLQRSTLLHNPLPLRDKIGLLLTGMIYQCSDSLSIWLGLGALGIELPANLAFGAYPLALLLSYAPITFAGFGVREPAAAAVLSTVTGGSLSWDQGVLAGVLVDGLEYVGPALFGLCCLPWLLRRARNATR